MRGNIYQDQATNEKILKYYTRISIKVSTKKIEERHQLLVFYFAQKTDKKIFEIFFKKVLTIRKRYAKISFVHRKWTKQKVHWKVNNRSFREKTKRWFSEMKMYQKSKSKKD